MDRMISEPECRRVTGLARTTRWTLERRGLFPKRRLLTGARVAWLESEILGWIQARGTRPEPLSAATPMLDNLPRKRVRRRPRRIRLAPDHGEPS